MTLESFQRAGSVLIQDLRDDLSAVTLPVKPHFVVRASHAGPLALTSLSLGFSLLLSKAIKSNNGWLVFPFAQPPQVGDSLGWTVFAGFPVPRLGAFFVVNKKIKPLKRKSNLAGGKSWAASQVLSSRHLS